MLTDDSGGLLPFLTTRSEALLAAAPDLDAKFYAAAQTLDDARHAETYARFLQDKACLLYPINTQLKSLLDDTLFQSLLLSRIVPCVKDIGLWAPKVQKAYADMDVLDMASVDLAALMKADEDIAEQPDAEKRELLVRRAEAEKTIAVADVDASSQEATAVPEQPVSA